MGNKITKFEDLIIWQKAVDMARSVNTIFPICKNQSSKHSTVIPPHFTFPTLLPFLPSYPFIPLPTLPPFLTL